MLEEGGRHQGDVAEGQAAKAGQDCPVALPPESVGLDGVVLQAIVGDRAELLQVVLDVERLVVDRLLADTVSK